MGFFGNVGNFITKNIRSGVKDVQGVILPILDTKGGEAAVKGIVAAKTGGASLQGGFNPFGGVGSQTYGPQLPADTKDMFTSLFDQLVQSTGANKRETNTGTTVQKPGEINQNAMYKENNIVDFIKTNKVTLAALTGIGLIIYIVSKKKNKPVRRTKRRSSSSMTARQKQLAALAKGRRTRLRNLRAKKK
jgi:hypothetical protein